MSVGAQSGLSVGIILLVLLICFILFVAYRRHRKRKKIGVVNHNGNGITPGIINRVLILH